MQYPTKNMKNAAILDENGQRRILQPITSNQLYKPNLFIFFKF